MEFLLLLPLLLVGGLAFGGGGGDEAEDATEEPAGDTGEVQAGTQAPNEMAGSILNDILLGGSGRDTIEGLGGNDVVAGEFGNDLLTGDGGNDVVLGGNGDDAVDGASGNDLLIGGAGDDTVTGGEGDDLLIGSSGADTLRADDGNDTLFGLEFDRISGEMAESADDLRAAVSTRFGDQINETQLDRVAGGVTSGNPEERAPDQLDGGAGDDLLFGDDGDMLTGGLGADDFGIAYRPGEEMSVITDFDHRSESLTVFVDNPETAQIVVRSFGPETTLIEVDGQPVVRLSGQDAATLLETQGSWLVVQRA